MFGLWVWLAERAAKIAIFILGIGIVLLALWAATAHAADAAIGDSIALGAGRALHVPTFAREGAGSCEIAGYRAVGREWGNVVISAGINDGGHCVASLRAMLYAKHVTWIVPAAINPGAAAVWAAMRPGDGHVTYTCRGGCSKRNFHPASYAAVAKAVRYDWRHH